MAPVKRLKRGDYILYYSPRERLNAGQPVQAFTAIGQVMDDEPYRVAQSECFEPFRRTVRYFDASDAVISPLLEELDLTRDRSSWGMVFRRGLFEIADRDFCIIARAMGVPERSWKESCLSQG